MPFFTGPVMGQAVWIEVRRVATSVLLALLAGCTRVAAESLSPAADPEAATPPVELTTPVLTQRHEMLPGTTLRDTLERWAVASGWTVRWASDRAYPIKGRATFDGDFVQAAGDLIRSFRQLNPPPVARFYLRNRELRVVTPGDEMGE
jgi:Toxin co-regulated pilus biosynthesis protein Q